MSKPKTLEEFNKAYPNWKESKAAWSGLRTMIDLELEAMAFGISIEEYLSDREAYRKAEINRQINELKRQL